MKKTLKFNGSSETKHFFFVSDPLITPLEFSHHFPSEPTTRDFKNAIASSLQAKKGEARAISTRLTDYRPGRRRGLKELWIHHAMNEILNGIIPSTMNAEPKEEKKYIEFQYERRSLENDHLEKSRINLNRELMAVMGERKNCFMSQFNHESIKQHFGYYLNNNEKQDFKLNCTKIRFHFF
ncbi:hypothetical protein NPIL_350321 [Nephila pilipes]|uniref:Uncharacterized protein n=1 Tax=Nephila pilipes TaxID=299642 RepID=A0A8X6N6A7_NEPPI|nr:hypothetical protein NPIL_350321 [Nephila pilipes]